MADPVSNVRLPRISDRLAIIGSTGGGKTQAAVWHLSMQPFDKMPYIVVDYKNDDLINSIERAEIINYKSLPKHAGIYILKVRPGEEEELTNFLFKVWERGKTGIYVDEGFMVGAENPAFNACLTQGRSKSIPMICLTQRPAWVSRFMFSESTFFQVFALTDKRDRKTVDAFVPLETDLATLPEYHSLYYDVAKKRLTKFAPVPDGDTILSAIQAKIKPRRSWF